MLLILIATVFFSDTLIEVLKLEFSIAQFFRKKTVFIIL